MRYVISVVAITLLLIGGWTLYQSYTREPAEDSKEVTRSPVAQSLSDGEDEGVVYQDGLVEVKTSARNFSFSEKEIRVTKGDKVRITLSNQEGFHDLVIDGFNVRTKRIDSGESDTVEFIANKVGEFEYYCSVGNHRQMGMVGKLVVENKQVYK
jgi:plastocyanin